MNRSSSLLVLAFLVASSTASVGFTQPTYSIDFQGPTALAPVFGGPGPVSDGDILTPVPPGMIPPPAVAIPVGAGGLGIAATGVHGGYEVDALSYGVDALVEIERINLWSFSVDEFAVGLPAPPPSVASEGALGAMEASADVYVTPTAGPLPPPGFPGFNVGLADGNGGLTPFFSAGLNLVEPNPPTPGSVPDEGDNLDAWDANTGRNPGMPVYFSLDAHFADPLEVPAGGVAPPNGGTAIANGFSGGDVLVTAAAGGPPALYAAAPALGLLPEFAGVEQETDDLDALVLRENGVPGYQPAVFDPATFTASWLVAGPDGVATDMLFYSVRRGSFAIGMPDGIFGAPIEEGDVLVPTLTGAGAIVPGIWIPAEALGLATVRSGAGMTWGLVNPAYGADIWADDLDALDNVPEPAAALLLITAVAAVAASNRRGRNETR